MRALKGTKADEYFCVLRFINAIRGIKEKKNSARTRILLQKSYAQQSESVLLGKRRKGLFFCLRNELQIYVNRSVLLGPTFTR